MPKLPDFREQNPPPLFLDTNDEVVDFNDAQVDVALRYGIPDWGALHVERLLGEELIVVASPALVPNEALPMNPASMARLPLLSDQ